MVVIQPHVWDRFTIYEDGDGRTISPSLIIKLTDDKTGEKPIGRIQVVIRKDETKIINEIRSIRNPSGYYIFTNLNDRNYSIDIDSDFYVVEKKIIDISKIKILDNIDLEFTGAGPRKGATKVKLKKVSELQTGYIIEFRDSEGQTEQRSIADIDIEKNMIVWKKSLKYDFNAQGGSIKALNFLFEIYLEPSLSYPFQF